MYLICSRGLAKQNVTPKILKQKLPNKEEVKAKLSLFSSKFPKKESKKSQKNLDLYEFLSWIRKVIIQAVENGYSSPEIRKNIEDIYQVKISQYILSNFCKENGIKTKTRNKKPKTEMTQEKIKE